MFFPNFRLGLEKIHQITSGYRAYRLRIDLTDWDGQTAYADYEDFHIEGEDQDYTIHYGSYSGTAGDSLDYINGLKFSTPDRDNDLHASFNCGSRGGWWYHSCSWSNLNGIYRIPPGNSGHNQGGIQWYKWKSAWYSMKQSTMRIRPVL